MNSDYTEAIIAELTAQRNIFADRCLHAAVQLAKLGQERDEALKKIEALEAEKGPE